MSVGAISSRFPVAVFLTLILLPTILFGVDGPWIGEDVPFQPRAAFPQRFSQRLFKEFGRWFGDRIGLRYPLIYAAMSSCCAGPSIAMWCSVARAGCSSPIQ